MDRLPNELLDEIFGACSKQDLINTRLTSKALARICATYLFDEYHLNWNLDGIVDLLAFVRCGHASGVSTVRVDNRVSTSVDHGQLKGEITYWSTRYPDLDSQFHSLFRIDQTESTENHLQSHQTLDQPCMRDDSVCNVVSNAFCAMPSLRRVCITDHQFTELPVYERAPWNNDSRFYHNLQQLCKHRSKRSVEDEDWIIPSILDSIARRADLKPPQQIVHLELIGCPRSCLSSAKRLGGHSVDGYSRRWESLIRAMQHIQCLRLCLMYDKGVSKQDEDAMDAEIRDLLRNCHSLRDLQMQRNDWGPLAADESSQARNGYNLEEVVMLEPVTAPLSSLLGSTSPIWPVLESLDLQGVNFLAADMLVFLEQHKNSLRRLAVTWCSIDDVDRVYLAIPTLSILDQITWRNLFHWSPHNPVAQQCFRMYGLETSAESWLRSNVGPRPNLDYSPYSNFSLGTDDIREWNREHQDRIRLKRFVRTA